MPEGNKKLYMWLCVGGAAAIIAGIWIASLKYGISVSISGIGKSAKAGAEYFSEVRGDLEKQIKTTRENLQNIEPAVATSTEEAVATEEAAIAATSTDIN